MGKRVRRETYRTSEAHHESYDEAPPISIDLPQTLAPNRRQEATGRRREEKQVRVSGNKYNLRELAGAFGDLGTLIPFLIGYITISKMDPVGILVAFGLFKIIAGLYFKTPIPIQPM